MDQETTSKSLSPASAPTAPLDQNILKRFGRFTKEIWSDHDFWIRTLAVKGGASALIVAGVFGMPHVMWMPIPLAVVAGAACCGLAALGVYTIGLGAASAWHKIRTAYSKTVSGKPLKIRPPKGQTWLQKQLERPGMQKQLQKPMMQKFLNSPMWKKTCSLLQKPRELLLTGMAMNGSLFWGTMSVIALVSNIVVLPVITIGSLLTVGTIILVGGVTSGIYGTYMSTQKMIQRFRHKEQTGEKASSESPAAEVSPPPVNTPPATESPSVPAPLTESFNDTKEQTKTAVAAPAARIELKPPGP